MKGTYDGIAKHLNRYQPKQDSRDTSVRIALIMGVGTAAKTTLRAATNTAQRLESYQDRHKRIEQVTEVAIVAFANKIKAPPGKRRREGLVSSPSNTKPKSKAKAAKQTPQNLS